MKRSQIGIAIIMVLLGAGLSYAQEEEAQDEGRKVSTHDLLQRLPKGYENLFLSDPAFEHDLDAKSKAEKRVMQDFEDYLLSASHPADECVDKPPLIRLYYAKQIHNFSNIHKMIKCKGYSLILDYWQFLDAKKAKIGARQMLQVPAFIYEDQVDRSFTGKKIGDFCIHTGDPETGHVGFYILYDRFFVDINLASKEPVEPKLMDEWAQAVLDKIKKGMVQKGEAVEQAK